MSGIWSLESGMYVCERLECGVANHSKVRATHYFAVFELNMAATLHKLYREEDMGLLEDPLRRSLSTEKCQAKLY